MSQKNQKERLLNEALSEPGVIPFYRGDEALVEMLCEIIGDLYRGLEDEGLTDKDIKGLL